jgi:hypothetical protein
MLYQRLDFSKYETRLLKLHPTSSAGQSSKPIVCELLHGVPLIEKPPQRPSYRALSYCWGDPSDTVSIVIDGRVVQVTKNLKAALLEVRRTITAPSLLWVDALCINQADEYEKREQIKNMGMIFQSAERVIAWVGVPRTAQEANMVSRYLLKPNLVSDLDDSSAEAFKACLQSFSVAPFWRRAWIIQELARGEPLDVRYGHLNIPWWMLKEALFKSDISHYLSQDFHALLLVLDQFQSRERDDRTGGRRVSLLEALFESREFLSTDRRDKIYALLGLSLDGNGIVPSPNYYEPWELVYAKATENIIAGQGKIGAIVLAGHKHFQRKENLPSWVPDWASLSDCVLAPWIAKCIEHTTSATSVRTASIGRAKATGDIPIRVTENRYIRLPAVIFETIHGVFATASSTAKHSPHPSTSQSQIDVRKLAWHIYDAINWTNARFKDFTISQNKKWTSHITDVSSVIGDKLHVLGIGNATLEHFVEFMRLLLDEYHIEHESADLRRIREWMRLNGSAKIGRSTLQEMLQEQLDAMQSFFSKSDAPPVKVEPPPACQEVNEESQSVDSIVEEKATLLRNLERLRIKSPSPSRRSFEEERRPSAENAHTRLWVQPITSVTAGNATIRMLGAERVMSLRSILTNRKLPNDDTIGSIAAGMNKFEGTRMRLATTSSRIRTVHENAEVGDKIAFLPNCPLPVVLRPVLDGARYKYIGEVYSETFAGLFKDGWGEKRALKSWPDTWEVEGVKIEKQDLITIE